MVSRETYSGQGALFASHGAGVGFVSTDKEPSHWELHSSLKDGQGRAASAQPLQTPGRECISSGQFGSPSAYHSLARSDL